MVSLVFSLHISIGFGEVKIILSHCFEASATRGSNLWGDSLVDLVFDELPSVSNTDELLVVTTALSCCCGLVLPPPFYPRASFSPRQTDTVITIKQCY